MSNIIQEFKDFEGLIKASKNNPDLTKELFKKFKTLSEEIINFLPAQDIKTEAVELLNGFEKNKPQIDRLELFVLRTKRIIEKIQQKLPLGISNESQLKDIKKLIMDALDRAKEKFKIAFKTELPELNYTRVYIIGSRVRGYSHDNSRAFDPERDVDILLVGDGIFNAEMEYLKKKGGFNSEINRFSRDGFIAGTTARFNPPFLGEAAVIIGEIFGDGDRSFFGEQVKSPIINFHMGTPSSKRVRDSIKDGIECH